MRIELNVEIATQATQARHSLVRGISNRFVASCLRLLSIEIPPLKNSHPIRRDLINRLHVSVEQFLEAKFFAAEVRPVATCLAVAAGLNGLVGCSSGPVSSKWAMDDLDDAIGKSKPALITELAAPL